MNATVSHRGILRNAKGFSRIEIKEAGLSCRDFCSLNLPFDNRRKTSYKKNVEVLKTKKAPKTTARKSPKPVQ